MTFGSFRPDSAITTARGVDRVHAAVDRRDEVLGVGVEDRVDRVEAQAVEVEVADPLLGALEHPLAHGVGVGVVEVHRLAPRRLVLST